MGLRQLDERVIQIDVLDAADGVMLHELPYQQPVSSPHDQNSLGRCAVQDDRHVGEPLVIRLLVARRDLEATVQYDLRDVYEAALKALGQLEMPVLSKSKTALNAEIRSITALDKKVKIILKRSETDNTKVSIRIGTFGDEFHSRMIYDKIVANI